MLGRGPMYGLARVPSAESADSARLAANASSVSSFDRAGMTVASAGARSALAAAVSAARASRAGRGRWRPRRRRVPGPIRCRAARRGRRVRGGVRRGGPGRRGRGPRRRRHPSPPRTRRSVRGARRGSGVRADPDLDAVRIAHPQRSGGAADPAGAALGGAGVGRVVVVVRLHLLPAGPLVGGGGTGADLDRAVQGGAGVVPDHSEERERPHLTPGQPLGAGVGVPARSGPGAGQGGEREGPGAAGDRPGGGPVRRGGDGPRGHGGRGRRGRGERQGECRRAGDADRGSKVSTHALDPGHSHTYLSIRDMTGRRPSLRRTGGPGWPVRRVPGAPPA